MEAVKTDRATQETEWAQRAPRTVTTLLVGKLLFDGSGEQLCRVRNLSATGMLIETQRALGYGNWIAVELRCGQRLQGTVAWSSSGRAGVQFAAPIEVDQVLAVARSASAARVVAPRAPRFAANLAARLINEGHPIDVTVENISQSGARVQLDEQRELDRSVTLTIPGLQPRRCTVRWSKGQTVGLAFMDMVPYDELAAVLGNGVAQG
jgi:hypothetical protein